MPEPVFLCDPMWHLLCFPQFGTSWAMKSESCTLESSTSSSTKAVHHNDGCFRNLTGFAALSMWDSGRLGSRSNTINISNIKAELKKLRDMGVEQKEEHWKLLWLDLTPGGPWVIPEERELQNANEILKAAVKMQAPSLHLLITFLVGWWVFSCMIMINMRSTNNNKMGMDSWINMFSDIIATLASGETNLAGFLLYESTQHHLWRSKCISFFSCLKTAATWLRLEH